jgi:colicin import membrane protein
MSRDVAVPLSISVLLHVLLVLALIFHFDFAAEAPEIKPMPNIIQAKLVSMNANAVARTKPVKKIAEPASEPDSTPPPAPEPTPEPPKPEPPKPEPVKVTPPPKPEPDKQKLLKLKQAEEAEKKAQDEKAKADAKKKEEQKKADEAKKADEVKKKAEETKKAEADKKEKERKEKEKQDALRKLSEKAARDDLSKALSQDEEAQSTNTEGQLVQGYAGAIKQAIERRWSRPPSARNGMSCLVQIQLIPTGEVVDVQIVKSSGDEAFDRSAVNAVKKAGQFPELQALKGGPEFEKNFRRFILPFIAEDLRQ